MNRGEVLQPLMCVFAPLREANKIKSSKSDQFESTFVCASSSKWHKNANVEMMKS